MPTVQRYGVENQRNCDPSTSRIRKQKISSKALEETPATDAAKIRNLDRMLAQLCTLDQALDHKGRLPRDDRKNEPDIWSDFVKEDELSSEMRGNRKDDKSKHQFHHEEQHIKKHKDREGHRMAYLLKLNEALSNHNHNENKTRRCDQSNKHRQPRNHTQHRSERNDSTFHTRSDVFKPDSSNGFIKNFAKHGIDVKKIVKDSIALERFHQLSLERNCPRDNSISKSHRIEIEAFIKTSEGFENFDNISAQKSSKTSDRTLERNQSAEKNQHNVSRMLNVAEATRKSDRRAKEKDFMLHHKEYEEDILRDNVRLLSFPTDEEDFQLAVSINEGRDENTKGHCAGSEGNSSYSASHQDNECKGKIIAQRSESIQMGNRDQSLCSKLSGVRISTISGNGVNGLKNDSCGIPDNINNSSSIQKRANGALPENRPKSSERKMTLSKSNTSYQQEHSTMLANVKTEVPDMLKDRTLPAEIRAIESSLDNTAKNVRVITINTIDHVASGHKPIKSRKSGSKSTKRSMNKDATINYSNHASNLYPAMTKEMSKTDILEDRTKQGDKHKRKLDKTKKYSDKEEKLERKENFGKQEAYQHSTRHQEHITQSFHRKQFEKEAGKSDRKAENYYGLDETVRKNYLTLNSHKDKTYDKQNKKFLNSKEKLETYSKSKNELGIPQRSTKPRIKRGHGANIASFSAQSHPVPQPGVNQKDNFDKDSWVKWNAAAKNGTDASAHARHRARAIASQAERNKYKVIDERKRCDRRQDIQPSNQIRKAKHSDVHRQTRIADTSKWHTAAIDVSTMIRSERRVSKHPITTPLHHVKATSKSASRPRCRKSISSDGTSSSSIISASTLTDSSYYSKSSSESSSFEGHKRESFDARKPNQDVRHTSSYESAVNRKSEKTKGRRLHHRSASSSSSFQRQRNNRQKPKSHRLYHNSEKISRKVVKTQNFPKKKEDDENQPPHSQEDTLFDTTFGNRRPRQPRKGAQAKDDDHFPKWQQHRLVLVSQTPGKQGHNWKSINQDAIPPKPSSTMKKSVSQSVDTVGDKRSPTIRDLYSLSDVLSNTQNGTVISGYRRSDGLRVAIKRISKAGTTRWGRLGGKVVPLELSLLCQVNEIKCRGVVEIVEWHETTEAFLLVMVRPHHAVDLYDYVTKHKRINEALAKHIVQQLVTALKHCVKLGVLHRDVKLENILLNPETMEVTLIDFGCGDYTRSGPYKEFAGTPEYYAPEWFQRKQYDGDSLTSWSVGVLLYSLLCGTLPFRSSREIKEKKATKFPSGTTRSARDLIERLLMKNPRERLSLNDILTHEWTSKSGRPFRNNSSA